MKIIFGAALAVFMLFARGAFALDSEANTVTASFPYVHAAAIKVELNETTIVKFSIGYMYVFMTSLENYLFTSTSGVELLNKGYKPSSNAVYGAFEIGYRSNTLYFGPTIGYTYLLPSTVNYTTAAYAAYNYSHSPALLTVEMGAGYELPLNKINNDFDLPMTFVVAVYSGYAWASMRSEYNVINDAVNGDYNMTINTYGQGASADFNFGVKFIDVRESGTTAGLNFGYKYCIIPLMAADKDYVTPTSNGRVIVVRKGVTFNNDMSMDFRGFRVSLDLGYAF
jgi:hypothetical protein